VGLDELEPCFTNDAATVWLLDLAEAPGPADLELLGPGERRRLARYADQRDAERYGAAHVGLRRLVARYLGVEPADVVIGRRPCPACASPEHGPPDIVAPHTDAGISLSRSGEHALVGIARAGAIGVDLEEVRDFDFGNVAPTVLSLAEQRYVHAQPPAGRALWSTYRGSTLPPVRPARSRSASALPGATTAGACATWPWGRVWPGHWPLPSTELRKTRC
jgi:hypothetical protein